jgi:predicted transcriptional regulator
MIEEELAELIFSLANTDRLILLNSLNDGKKSRLGDLASILSVTPQETSKHLIRLRNEKVVDKDPDGFFFLTEFGKSITKIIPMTRFLLKNKDYCLSHSLSSLPLQFIERIGEIEECEYNSDAFSIFSTFESIVADAKEYVWLMADYPYGGVDVIDSKK